MTELATTEIFPIEIWVGIIELAPRLYGAVARLSRTHYGVLRRDLERFKQAACERVATAHESYWKLPNGLYHGKYIRYNNDMLMSRVNYMCHYVDGRMHGPCCQYYGSSMPYLKCEYVRGKIHGEVVFYDYWGDVKGVDEYVHGALVKSVGSGGTGPYVYQAW